MRHPIPFDVSHGSDGTWLVVEGGRYLGMVNLDRFPHPIRLAVLGAVGRVRAMYRVLNRKGVKAQVALSKGTSKKTRKQKCW